MILATITFISHSCSFSPLRPTGFFNDTLSPDGVDRTIVSNVARDNGFEASRSDWFEICRLDRFTASAIGFIGLFVDTSGSMTLNTVRASYNFFLSRVADSNNTVANVFNGQERFITPFLTTLVP